MLAYRLLSTTQLDEGGTKVVRRWESISELNSLTARGLDRIRWGEEGRFIADGEAEIDGQKNKAQVVASKGSSTVKESWRFE